MQGSEWLLKARVERVKGFDGAIEIQTDWRTQGVSKEPTVTIPAGKNEATFKIQANDKAAAGTYRIAMHGSHTGGDAYSGVGRVRVSSEILALKIAEPYLSLELLRSSVEQGNKAEGTGPA